MTDVATGIMIGDINNKVNTSNNIPDMIGKIIFFIFVVFFSMLKVSSKTVRDSGFIKRDTLKGYNTSGLIKHVVKKALKSRDIPKAESYAKYNALNISDTYDNDTLTELQQEFKELWLKKMSDTPLTNLTFAGKGDIWGCINIRNFKNYKDVVLRKDLAQRLAESYRDETGYYGRITVQLFVGRQPCMWYELPEE